MKIFREYFLEFWIIVLSALIFYIFTIDLFIFNQFFLQTDYLTWLFYLLPIFLSLLLLSIALLIKNKSRLIKFILIILSNIYLFLSLFMVTGIYCENEKNLSSVHIGIVLLISALIFGLQFKNVFRTFPKWDIALVSLSTFVVLIDLFVTLLIFNLIYSNWSA